MYASTLTRAAGMTLTAAMLVLISGLIGAKLPAPTEEQKAQADLTKAKAAWGDEVTTFQTCKAQDKTAASYQAGGKTAHTQPGAPCMDSGPFVTPVPATSTPAPAAKGWTVGSNVACSPSDSTIVHPLSEPWLEVTHEATRDYTRRGRPDNRLRIELSVDGQGD